MKEELLAMSKVKKVTVDGIEYTLQHPGMREAVKMRDRCKKDGDIVEEKYYKEIMDFVIVEPRVSWEYWDEHDGFQEVMTEAIKFCNNK